MGETCPNRAYSAQFSSAKEESGLRAQAQPSLCHVQGPGSLIFFFNLILQVRSPFYCYCGGLPTPSALICRQSSIPAKRLGGSGESSPASFDFVVWSSRLVNCQLGAFPHRSMTLDPHTQLLLYITFAMEAEFWTNFHFCLFHG